MAPIMGLLALLVPAAAPVAQAQATACNPIVEIDSPASGTVVTGQVEISGFAFDQDQMTIDTVQQVEISLDAPTSEGGQVLAVADQVNRPDIDAQWHREHTHGFHAIIDLADIAPGQHTLYANVLTPCGDAASAVAIDDGNPAVAFTPYQQFSMYCNPYYPTPQPAYPLNTPCDMTGQYAPTSLTATQIAPGEVSLSWAPVTGATGYAVYITSPMTEQLTSVDGATTSVDVDNLDLGQSYTFSVVASGEFGASASISSNAVTIAY
jgi:hypothetical protein